VDKSLKISARIGSFVVEIPELISMTAPLEEGLQKDQHLYSGSRVSYKSLSKVMPP
jgi:hypothetical protein